MCPCSNRTTKDPPGLRSRWALDTSNMLPSERRSLAAAASQARRHSGVSLLVATFASVLSRTMALLPRVQVLSLCGRLEFVSTTACTKRRRNDIGAI